MVRCLVLFFDDGADTFKTLAQSVCNGSQKAGGEAALVSYSQWSKSGMSLDAFDLIFLEADLTHLLHKNKAFERFLGQSRWPGRSVAFFGLCSNSRKSKDEFKALCDRMGASGASVKNTLALAVKGALSFLGRGSLEEIDFVRAEAFGERTTNYFSGRRVSQPSEKARISGYRK